MRTSGPTLFPRTFNIPRQRHSYNFVRNRSKHNFTEKLFGDRKRQNISKAVVAQTTKTVTKTDPEIFAQTTKTAVKTDPEILICEHKTD